MSKTYFKSSIFMNKNYKFNPQKYEIGFNVLDNKDIIPSPEKII